jgi:hypothetical protein
MTCLMISMKHAIIKAVHGISAQNVDTTVGGYVRILMQCIDHLMVRGEANMQPIIKDQSIAVVLQISTGITMTGTSAHGHIEILLTPRLCEVDGNLGLVQDLRHIPELLLPPTHHIRSLSAHQHQNSLMHSFHY